MRLLLVVLLFTLFTLPSSFGGERPHYKHSWGRWCVARPSASDRELTENINLVCQFLEKANCKQLIHKGGRCYEPNTLINHASVVMNAYYAENGKKWWNCDFKGTALVTVTKPSYGVCEYA